MLDAAIELILEQGVDASMKAIGERAGFSHGLVLARFGSKAGLSEAVAREAQRRFAETVESTVSEAGGMAKLHGTIDVYLRTLLTVGRAFYVLLGASLGPSAPLREAFAQADKAFRRFMLSHLKEAQADGDLDSSVNSTAMAALLVGMLRGVAMQCCIDPAALEIEAVAAEAHGLIERLAGTHGRARSSRAAATAPAAPLPGRRLKVSTAA